MWKSASSLRYPLSVHYHFFAIPCLCCALLACRWCFASLAGWCLSLLLLLVFFCLCSLVFHCLTRQVMEGMEPPSAALQGLSPREAPHIICSILSPVCLAACRSRSCIAVVAAASCGIAVGVAVVVAAVVVAASCGLLGSFEVDCLLLTLVGQTIAASLPLSPLLHVGRVEWTTITYTAVSRQLARRATIWIQSGEALDRAPCSETGNQLDIGRRSS